MTALLLAPHNDDETLFAAYTCIRERPDVVIVLSDRNSNADDADEREKESRQALSILLDVKEMRPWQWPHPAGDPDWDVVKRDMEHLERGFSWQTRGYDRIYAPWPEPGGHPEHNRVGELAREVFDDRVTHYTTYRYGGPRSTGIPVQPEPEWILLKLRALACYRSQILGGPRRFFQDALHEWYAP